MYELLLTITLVVILIASYTDIKTREVPDWLNYSLIASALGIRGVISLVYLDYHPITYGLIGLAAMFLLALLLFQTGQWGGGDAKLLMGVGAAMGIEFSWPPTILIFLILLVILGAIYGFIWSLSLAIIKWDTFKKTFLDLMSKKSYSIARKINLLLAILLVATVFLFSDPVIKLMILSGVALLFFGFYVWVGAKAVELSCMQKLVSPEKLTEGDWIVKDIKINGKYICGPKDLGIEQKQITKSLPCPFIKTSSCCIFSCCSSEGPIIPP